MYCMQSWLVRMAGWIALGALCVMPAVVPAKPLVVTPVLVSGDVKEAHCQRPIWSRHGKWLAFEVSVSDKRKEQFLARIGDKLGTEFDLLKVSIGGTSRFAKKRGWVCHELSWEPTGAARFLLSCGERSVGNYNIYLAELFKQTINMTLITRARDNDGWPAWGVAGGKNLMLYTSGKTGKGDIYLLELGRDESTTKRITKSAETEDFAVWSPDQRSFLFVERLTRTGGEGVYLADPLAPSPRVRVVADFANSDETNPSWSPDGKRIAFYSNRGKRQDKKGAEDSVYDLYVVEVGKEPERIASNVVKSDGLGPAWHPDGQHILFARYEPKSHNPLYLVRLKGRRAGPTQLRTGTLLNENAGLVRRRDGTVLVAFTAQGKVGDPIMRWRKLFVAELPKLR